MPLMDNSFFDLLHSHESRHWWFYCRRKLAAAALRKHATRQTGYLLDMGCGTGAMLGEMQNFGTTFGLDIAPTALQYCRTRGHLRLTLGSGEDIPFRDAAFDAVVSLDVIEHIDNDVRAMEHIHRICRDGGTVVITVPAVPWLWTTRDERLLHKRRYTRLQLIALAQGAGFEIIKCSYYCVFFFPAMAAFVFFNRILGHKPDYKDDVPAVPTLPNMLLRWILLLEQSLLRWINYPFGVSLFCVLRKPSAP